MPHPLLFLPEQEPFRDDSEGGFQAPALSRGLFW